MHPLNRQRQLLAAAVLLSVCLGSGDAPAEAPRLDTIDFQSGMLTIQAAQPLAQPSIDMWPTQVDGKPAEIVILKFSGATADPGNLNRQVSAIMSAHPEVKRLMVAPEEGGVQVVLETLAASDNPPRPALLHGTPFQWQVNLAGGESFSDGSGEQNARRASGAPDVGGERKTVVSGSERKAEDAGKLSFLSGLMGGKRQSADAATANNSISELQSLGAQLQAMIRERDALETQVLQLQQEVKTLRAAAKPPITSGAAMTPQVNDILREYDPAFDKPHMRESVTIANLRGALVKLATRLKETEAALQEERGKSALRLAEALPLAQDAVKDPIKPITPVKESKGGEAVGKKVTAQPAVTRPAVSVASKPKGIIYKPPAKSDATEAVSNPAKDKASKSAVQSGLPAELSKEREIALRAALQETPGNIAASLKLADLYVGRRDLSQAESVLTRLIARNPAAKEGYYYLALVYLGQQRGLEAQAALDTYQRLNPTDRTRINEARAAIRSSLGKSVSNQ